MILAFKPAPEKEKNTRIRASILRLRVGRGGCVLLIYSLDQGTWKYKLNLLETMDQIRKTKRLKKVGFGQVSMRRIYCLSKGHVICASAGYPKTTPG